MGLDPGSNHCGVAVIEFDYTNLQLYRVTGTTLEAAKIKIPLAQDLVETHGERYVKTFSMGQALKGLLEYYDPQQVCCESPFYHRLHPGAFAPLVESVYALRNAVAAFNPLIPFTTYEPLVIKKIMSGKAFADKDLMRTSLLNNSEITAVLEVPVSQLSEHAIDAIAIAWTHLQLAFKR
jgi:Holliday junction resolvasome RuvABC endonuclease subunit